jgi:uncharacterized protein YjbI with pentapeptide repeats
MPLVEVLTDLVEAGKPQSVALHGQGCSTSLQYVQAWADERGLPISVSNFWNPEQASATTALIRVARTHEAAKVLTLFLCAWERDEFIEYLLTYHPSQCKRVMTIISSYDQDFAYGSPYFWQPYLDWLAEHEQAVSPDRYVLQVVREQLDSDEAVQSLADRMLESKNANLLDYQVSPLMTHWLRLDDVHLTLMSARLADHVMQGRRSMLEKRWPGHLLNATARVLVWRGYLDSQEANIHDQFMRQVEWLKRAANYRRYATTAISLLTRLPVPWKPRMRRAVDLSFSDLRCARWSKCGLRKANLHHTDLSDAELSSANLRRTSLHGTRFDRSDMRFAQLTSALGQKTSFKEADLSNADLKRCQLTHVDFSRARMQESTISQGMLTDVSMHNASLASADFTACALVDVSFEKADLKHACFRAANFIRVRFKGASLQSAVFSQSSFEAGTVLECMDFSGCDFLGAKLHRTYLTDSKATCANFRLADLSQAGLAGVVWEDCDLRGADFRGAAFHFGSTRCGLVGSPYPSHGTRTGFYTDDYVDLSFKNPEQIRKAALVGCDLRGALIEGCDFYLVDVRDCLLDDHQRVQLAACGAILE